MQDDIIKLKKILKEYLREFYVKPLDPDSILKQNLDVYLSNAKKLEKKTLAFSVSNLNEVRQVAQYYLLSFEKRLFWNAYNSYDFIDIYFDNESIVQHTLNFPVIIVYHTGLEIPNKLLPDMLNQILTVRDLKPDYYSLFLTCADISLANFKVVSLLENTKIKNSAIFLG